MKTIKRITRYNRCILTNQCVENIFKANGKWYNQNIILVEYTDNTSDMLDSIENRYLGDYEIIIDDNTIVEILFELSEEWK